MDNGKKNITIQSLRGLACMGVFLYHVGFLKSGGGVGVQIFFVLSGFLLMQKKYTEDLNVKKCLVFAIHKIRRLYSLHITMLVFAVPLLVKNCAQMENKFFNIMFRIVVNAFLIQAWIPDSSIKYSMNSLSWFLSVMLFLYFSYPAIHCFIEKKLGDAKKKVSGIIIATFLSVAYLVIAKYLVIYYELPADYYRGFTYNFPIFRLYDFTVGCLLGGIYKDLGLYKKSFNKSTYTILEIILCSILLVMMSIDWNIFVTGEETLYWGFQSILFMVPVCGVVWLFMIDRGIITNFFSRSIFVSLGNISGKFYLVHEMILIYLGFVLRYLNFNGSIYYFIKAVVGFIVTLIFVVIWSRWVESKEMVIKRR